MLVEAFTPVVQMWPVLAAFIGFGIWVVRMEAKVQGNAKDILRLENRLSQDRADTQRSLEDLTDMLREQNRDIKILLGRGHVQHWNDPTIPPRGGYNGLGNG